MMKCFHRTPCPESILENGFRDGEGTYLTGIMHKGVWVSDCPLSVFEGAKGDDLLSLDIPDDVLSEFEWIEEGKPYREFLIPAEIVNSHGPPELVDEDDYDWWTTKELREFQRTLNKEKNDDFRHTSRCNPRD